MGETKRGWADSRKGGSWNTWPGDHLNLAQAMSRAVGNTVQPNGLAGVEKKPGGSPQAGRVDCGVLGH